MVFNISKLKKRMKKPIRFQFKKYKFSVLFLNRKLILLFENFGKTQTLFRKFVEFEINLCQKIHFRVKKVIFINTQ